jgi:hypothetical protein
MNVCIYKGVFGVKFTIKSYSGGEGVGVITFKRLLDELSVFEIFFFQNLESRVIDVMV